MLGAYCETVNEPREADLCLSANIGLTLEDLTAQHLAPALAQPAPPVPQRANDPHYAHRAVKASTAAPVEIELCMEEWKTLKLPEYALEGNQTVRSDADGRISIW